MDQEAVNGMMRQVEEQLHAVAGSEPAPWHASIRNVNQPQPPVYAAEEKQHVQPQFVAPPPLQVPPSPLPQAQPFAGERVLQRPPSLYDVLSQHVHYDLAHNQMLRQNSPDGGRAVVAPAVFRPSAPMLLTPVVDPTALEGQIERMKAEYPHVDWSPKAIKARKDFLARVDLQRKTAIERCLKQVREWSMQQSEYISLREYDEAMEGMVNELESAKKMLGGRKRSRSPDSMEL
jgi:hypothetical protein